MTREKPAETITFADLLADKPGDDIDEIRLHARNVQTAAMQAIFDGTYELRYLQVFPASHKLAEATPEQLAAWWKSFYEWTTILTPEDRDRLANERVMVK